MTVSNETLLAQCRYSELWARSEALVKSALGRLLRQGSIYAITDDMLQDAHIAAGKACRSWNPAKGAFSTWITINVAHAATDHQRREGNTLPTEQLDERRLVAPQSDVFEKILRRQTRERIKAALATLPEAD